MGSAFLIYGNPGCFGAIPICAESQRHPNRFQRQAAKSAKLPARDWNHKGTKTQRDGVRGAGFAVENGVWKYDWLLPIWGATNRTFSPEAGAAGSRPPLLCALCVLAVQSPPWATGDR